MSRPRGVDHVFVGQAARARDCSLAKLDRAFGLAVAVNLAPSATEDCSRHAGTQDQFGVRGIDESIYVGLVRNIALDDFDSQITNPTLGRSSPLDNLQRGNLRQSQFIGKTVKSAPTFSYLWGSLIGFDTTGFFPAWVSGVGPLRALGAYRSRLTR